jgi:hypothetical protein
MTTEARVKISLGPGRTVEVVLRGPARAIEDLVGRLRGVGGALEVAGGRCCWTLSQDGTTFHLLVDSDKVA